MQTVSPPRIRQTNRLHDRTGRRRRLGGIEIQPHNAGQIVCAKASADRFFEDAVDGGCHRRVLWPSRNRKRVSKVLFDEFDREHRRKISGQH
jgi:hypothetical protein